MNINDFNIPLPPGDKLILIFDHQLELLHKYHDIEERNLGYKIPGEVPLDLHHPANQQRLKDFAWRIIEELGEATECLTPTESDKIHYLEEMVDALHFTVELDHFSGVGPHDIVCPGSIHEDLLDDLFKMMDHHKVIDPFHPKGHPMVRMITWMAAEKLATAMNCLKNKPWKSTHMATDVDQYRKKIVEFNQRFFNLLRISGFDPTSLTQCYLNKNAVNQFRIRTNY